MKRLTVFTPSYNRANLIGRGYEALCRQSCHDFQWLIIDDGSRDETRSLCESWISVESLELKEDGFEGYSKDAPWLHIRYCYKENGGLHTAYNKAIELMDTELCVCIDSDDYMPDDAVEKILKLWKEKGSDNVAGIMGLDFYCEGKPIGGYFQDGIETLHIIDMVPKYHHHGDVKVVHRTALLKEVAPMPTFKGEKNFNPIYLFHKVDMKYPLLLLNDNLCFVEYQSDGMTFNIYNQFLNSPRSFSELRRLYMSRTDVSLKFKFRNAIHYVSSQIMVGNKRWLAESPEKLLTLLAVPLGIMLYLYIHVKAKRNEIVGNNSII